MLASAHGLNTHGTCPHCCSDGTQEKILSFTVFDNVLALRWTFSTREFWWTDENIFHTKNLSKWKKCRGCYSHVFIFCLIAVLLSCFCNIDMYICKYILWSTSYLEQKNFANVICLLYLTDRYFGEFLIAWF